MRLLLRTVVASSSCKSVETVAGFGIAAALLLDRRRLLPGLAAGAFDTSGYVGERSDYASRQLSAGDALRWAPAKST